MARPRRDESRAPVGHAAHRVADRHPSAQQAEVPHSRLGGDGVRARGGAAEPSAHPARAPAVAAAALPCGAPRGAAGVAARPAAERAGGAGRRSGPRRAGRPARRLAQHGGHRRQQDGVRRSAPAARRAGRADGAGAPRRHPDGDPHLAAQSAGAQRPVPDPRQGGRGGRADRVARGLGQAGVLRHGPPGARRAACRPPGQPQPLGDGAHRPAPPRLGRGGGRGVGRPEGRQGPRRGGRPAAGRQEGPGRRRGGRRRRLGAEPHGRRHRGPREGARRRGPCALRGRRDQPRRGRCLGHRRHLHGGHLRAPARHHRPAGGRRAGVGAVHLHLSPGRLGAGPCRDRRGRAAPRQRAVLRGGGPQGRADPAGGRRAVVKHSCP